MANEKSRERYDRIVESIEQLPSLPSIVMRLIQVVNSPDTSAEDAANLIERDPALTSKMLRLANSAFYGIPRSISSVQSAVVILGFNTIKSLVLSASVMRLFSDKGAATFDRAQFWKHSIVCAMAAKRIVRALMPAKLMDPESAFCAGILHDIGKLVFEQHVHEDYRETCDYARITNTALIEAESHIMGINHAEAGRILADRWALPVELEAAIVSHHDPRLASSNVIDLVAAVHIANAMTHELGVKLWENEVGPQEWEEARGMLRLDAAAYERIRDEVGGEMEKSEDFFAIIR